MIIYLLKSTILLVLLLGVYKLFLENEKMHTFNRFFLLAALILGLTAPLVQINVSPDTTIAGFEIAKVESTVNAPSELVAKAIEPIISGNPAPVSVSENQTDIVTPTQPEKTFLSRTQILLFVYGIITFLLLIRFWAGLFELFSKVRVGVKSTFETSTLILLDEKITPQSFLRWIFLNKTDFESGKINPEILEHELTHIRQKHSLDVLFIELIKMVFWFNPVLYFYKHAIQLNHEFLADEHVLKKGSSIKSYQQILIRACAYSKEVPTITSKFNQSNTKKRFKMLSKTIFKTRIRTRQIFSGLVIIIFSMLLIVKVNAQNIQEASVEDLVNELQKKLQKNDPLNLNEQQAISKFIELAYLKNPNLINPAQKLESKEFLEKEFSRINQKKNTLFNEYFGLAKSEPAPDLDTLEKKYKLIQAHNRFVSLVWNQLRAKNGEIGNAPPGSLPPNPQTVLKQRGQ